MARGWESKAVEEQMAEKQLSAQHDLSLTEEQRRRAMLAEASQKRVKQALELQRENILSQKTTHPARRQALDAALKQIEGQLAGLE